MNFEIHACNAILFNLYCHANFLSEQLYVIRTNVCSSGSSNKTWIRNYMDSFIWDAIYHPCPNINGCLTEWVLVNFWKLYTMHTSIKIISGQQKIKVCTRHFFSHQEYTFICDLLGQHVHLVKINRHHNVSIRLYASNTTRYWVNSLKLRANDSIHFANMFKYILHEKCCITISISLIFSHGPPNNTPVLV